MAPKRPLPFVLPASLPERQRQQRLRRYKIKPSNIARTFEGDGWILYIPTKKSYFNLPKEMVPSRELEHRIRTIHDYVEEYKALIDVERRAEMEAQMREIRSTSGKEREFFGRAVLGLKGRSAGRKFDLYLVRFGRERAIETEIAGGDIVLVSRGDPLKSDLTATVMQVGRNFIEAAFAQKPPKWVRDDGIRLDLFVNDVTFKRMESNLERLRHIEPPYARVRDIVIGLAEAKGAMPAHFEPENGTLNDAQRQAVATALGSGEIALIHGPPGTGKTTTVVEAILQLTKRGKKVLATADSNVAVDNMLEKLAEKKGVKPVRIGHPARIDAKLERFSLMAMMEQDPRARQVERMLEEAKALVDERNRHSKPTPARLRGMGRERVKTLAATGRSYRGVDIKTIQSMARWIAEDEKVERFYGAIRELEEAMVREILEKADVVLSTNGMIGSEAMEGMRFDVAVVDEGSQQMEPSTLMALTRVPKAVLAGDHRQLPPTVVSNLDLLKRSLFERLMERNLPSVMLDLQYRMNETVMDFPNRLMYEGRLQAHPSVAGRRLRLEKMPREEPEAAMAAPESPVVFADTSGLDAHERLPERSTSYENPTEAAWVVKVAETLVRCGVAEEDIGIITPYLSQVKLIRRLLEAKGLACETKSVDGFQGREKEVILISFVRSNVAKEIGFVKDRRRLNVAMTRARSKLVMVGDVRTLEPNDPYDRLLVWVRKHGKVVLLE
ncbi:IGHMBP2 family helicase [Hydrogenimonas sp. SS33]|uniref:IGHMBP2 family helicase n=1 Tax=Hydrogenimonas leucolamina TaxID=2954236 RepID=UPI00336BEE1A